MKVFLEGFYHEHISKHVLKIHAFCKTVANFRRYVFLKIAVLKFVDLVNKNVCGGLQF